MMNQNTDSVNTQNLPQTGDTLDIGGQTFSSRLFVGTGKFGDLNIMRQALKASGSKLVTVALKRVDLRNTSETPLLQHLLNQPYDLLPNTSGARNAKEAVFACRMAREAFGTHRVKLEIHPDPKYLMPDNTETVAATRTLVKEGFTVFPYIGADPVACKQLEDVGAAAVMPLGSPIGSHRGLDTLSMLEIIIDQANIPVVIDAGIGKPSHAAQAMEIGADAVLINTAIAINLDPVRMAKAFKKAVEAGREAFLLGTGRRVLEKTAASSSPLTKFLDEL